MDQECFKYKSKEGELSTGQIQSLDAPKFLEIATIQVNFEDT